MTTVPYGDPGAMRGFAFDLRLAADRLGGLGRTAGRSAAVTAWEGPAAIDFRGNVAEITTGLGAAATRLLALSDYLVRQAAVLESRQDEARREIALEERLAEARGRRLP